MEEEDRRAGTEALLATRAEVEDLQGETGGPLATTAEALHGKAGTRRQSYLGSSLLQKGLMRMQGLRTRRTACVLHETRRSLK